MDVLYLRSGVLRFTDIKSNTVINYIDKSIRLV